MLEEAFAETKKAKQEAEILGDDYLMFKADLLRGTESDVRVV